jgi:hypothetical protein
VWHAWGRKIHGVWLGNLKERDGWKHNSEMDLKDIYWDGIDWIHLAQDRCEWWAVMNMVMNLWVA